jgi:hypothetical protein
MPHFWRTYRDGESPPSRDTGVRILLRCGMQPRTRGENRMARQVIQIAADTGQIYALCDDGEIFRFSGETWHHVSPFPQGDPRDATKPKQKPGFVVHVDDEPGG